MRAIVGFAPLPFRTHPASDSLIIETSITRLTSLLRTLEKKPEMKSHFVTFMQNIFDRDHAEVVPPLREGQELGIYLFLGCTTRRSPVRSELSLTPVRNTGRPDLIIVS